MIIKNPERLAKLIIAIVVFSICTSAVAQRPSFSDRSPKASQQRDGKRPDRTFVKPPTMMDAHRFRERRPYSPLGEEFRTFNGVMNNLSQPRYGSIFVELIRLAPTAYGPNNSLARQDAASPRSISNVTCHQPWSEAEPRQLSDMVWQWGQFVDHDLDLTQFQAPKEAAPISVPLGDPIFDPGNVGNAFIPFDRSLHVQSFTRVVRQQLNGITAWIDASNVYGSERNVASNLRALKNGRLKTTDGGEFGDLLPFNESGTQFMAGDIRAAEQAGLTCMHTLFMREHNRIADEIQKNDPQLSDEMIYQLARKKVYAIIESITYNEFLPALLGEDNLLPEYSGYQDSVNPNIANEFSTCGYRFGHTMLSNQLQRLDSNNEEIAEGHILLRNAFFNPNVILGIGIDPYLRGLARQNAQEIDMQLNSGVRNFLFSNQPNSPMGFDLAALNIQRGRDHGLPDYNTLRVAYSLPAVDDVKDISSDILVQAQLMSMYPSVDDIDPWIGILAEDHASNSSIGPTAIAIIKDQFQRVRDGDRFWYENVFSGDDLDEIQKTTLSDVIRRNTDIDNEIPDNVFFTTGN